MASTSKFKRLISADSHVQPPYDMWWKALGDKFGDRTPRVVEEYRGLKGPFLWTGADKSPISRIEAFEAEIEAGEQGFAECGYNPEVRVRFQEQAGVDAEVLNATWMLNILRNPDSEVKRACAEVFNDFMIDFISYDPKRLIGVSVIPMDDMEWAVAELERTTAKGIASPMINCQAPVGCPPFRDSSYDRFWAAAQDLGTPLTLHSFTGRVAPSPGASVDFMTEEEKGETPSWWWESFSEIQPVLANDFIFGRIFDRFPGVKLVLSEWEMSWVPSFIGRMDQAQEIGPGLRLPKLERKAGEYVTDRCWHGFIDDVFAQFCVAQVGVDKVMWGSDFPHVRSIGLGAVDTATGLLSTLPEEDAQKIVADNAAALFGLD